jgi:hypothetical protein
MAPELPCYRYWFVVRNVDLRISHLEKTLFWGGMARGSGSTTVPSHPGARVMKRLAEHPTSLGTGAIVKFWTEQHNSEKHESILRSCRAKLLSLHLAVQV